MNRLFAWATTAVVSLAGAVAAQAWPENSTPEFDALLNQARAEGVFVLLAPADFDGAFMAQFTADTGIATQFIVASRSEGRARFVREIEAGAATMDAYLGGRTQSGLLRDDLLMPLAPALMLGEVTDPANWRDGTIPFYDAEARYSPVPSHYASGYVLVNSALIDVDKVQNWADLLHPDLTGRIVAHDYNIRGSGISLASYLIDSLGADYVRALMVGQQVALLADYRQLVDSVARGTHAVALGALATDIEYYRAQGIDTLSVLRMNDAPGYVSGGAAALVVPVSAPHPAAAKVFANWYLSRSGQQAMVAAYANPSDRSDVDNSAIPDYLVPGAGETYLDTYRQDYVSNVEPGLLDAFSAAVAQ